jgi:hypothetical protein
VQTHVRGTGIRRGRTVVVGITAAALLGACAASYDPGMYSADGYLQARIYQPASGALQFAISQPAYAAVFAVVPGRGATLVYPSTPSEAQRPLSPGTHSYLSSALSYNRLSYASGIGSFYGSSLNVPTTLVLIASSAPLHVSRLMRYPALAGDLKLTSFYSEASGLAVGRLAELIIPDPVNTDWTYDTYTIWPDEQGRQVAAYRIRCADGRVVLVARGVYPIECGVRGGQTPPPLAVDTASADPADTGRAAPPRRPGGLSEPSRRNPGGSAGVTDGVREARAPLRPRGGELRESQPRSASQPRVRTAPPRERRQAEPARQRPAEKSKRSARSSRIPPAS